MIRIALIWLSFTFVTEAATTDGILARMDAAGASFRGMSAKIRKISYTAIIKESNEESGMIKLRSPKPKQVAALIEFTKPDVRSIAFSGKRAQIYLPKINTVQEWNLGKFDDLLTQGLLIGFATPSKDLKKNYRIRLLGEETIEGQKVFKLELLPVVESIKQHITRIELWIGDTESLPVQERLYQASGDYTQIIYSDMKLDSGITDKSVKLRLPANVKREFPQK